jgi:amidophosphoribosyltransferase
MSGIVGITCNRTCKDDLFYATDYHSHLGVMFGGIAMRDGDQTHRKIHSIAKAQFKTRFSDDIDYLNMRGSMGLGVISDRDTQPLIMNLKFGAYAICGVGYIDNQDELARELIRGGVAFTETQNGRVNQIELAGHLVYQGRDLLDGIENMHRRIRGSMSLLMMNGDGLYAARDKYGRTPLIVAKRAGARIVVSETCAYKNLNFATERYLGPGEVVLVTPRRLRILKKPEKVSQLCTFLFVYTGFPASEYEGKSVEEFREDSGRVIARKDNVNVDLVTGIADSGTAYAIGYSHESGVPFRLPLLKYTPGWSRSYVPPSQETRNLVALMKQITIPALTKGQRLVITEDSIVRGTQLKNFLLVKLWHAGAREIHVRPACPALMFPCKFLFSTRKMNELFARRILRSMIGRNPRDVRPYLYPDSREYRRMIRVMEQDLNISSLKYQRLEDMLATTGLPRESLCTYCWTGREIP